MMINWEQMDWNYIPSSYCCMEDNQYKQEGRAVYQDAYERNSIVFHPYKHKNFDAEVCRSNERIHSNFFEMACGLFLKENGTENDLILQKTPDGDGNPDLLFFYKKRKLWAECSVPRRGDAKTSYSVPIRYNGKHNPIAASQSLSRIASVLKDKKDQYAERIDKKIVSSDDLYLIAICGDFLELPNLPIPGASIGENIVRLLNGGTLHVESNARVSDFSNGISWLNYGFSGTKTDKTICINFLDKIEDPDVLAVAYFQSSNPINTNSYYLFCTGSSPFVELGESLSFKTVTLLSDRS